MFALILGDREKSIEECGAVDVDLQKLITLEADFSADFLTGKISLSYHSLCCCWVVEG